LVVSRTRLKERESRSYTIAAVIRLAIVITHPIQYHAPLYQFLARDKRFDLKVFYMSDRGSRAYYDAFARAMVSYDNPILQGYDYTFLSTGEPKTWLAKKTEMYRFSLRRELARWRPGAVYFHGYDNPAFWPAIKWCRGNRVAVLFRGENEDVLPRPPGRVRLRELFLKLLIPAVDAFLYIGKENRRFFLKRGVPESKLFYVPYSVDNNYFRGGVTDDEVGAIRASLRERYGLTAGTRLFIYTHKLRETMRPLDAVRAFASASASFTRPTAFIVCGSGELQTACEDVARQSPSAQIRFAGFISQSSLREHLLGSDIMINPAIEPWGCSVNEGLAGALAMISSDMVVGWPDMVRPGVNGEVYRCGDVDALAALIRDFAGRPDEEIEAMKSASFRLASDVLSFATCADGIAAAAGSFHPS
jgi:glycosyltransferase involved in cell wall biosynthesis